MKTKKMHGSFQLCSIFLYTPQGLNLLPMSLRKRRNSMGLKLQDLKIQLLVSIHIYNKCRRRLPEEQYESVYHWRILNRLDKLLLGTIKYGRRSLGKWANEQDSRGCFPLHDMLRASGIQVSSLATKTQRTWPHTPCSQGCSILKFVRRATSSPCCNRNLTCCVVLLLLLSIT